MCFEPNVQIEKRNKQVEKRNAFKKVGHILYKVHYKAGGCQDWKKGVLEVCRLFMVA